MGVIIISLDVMSDRLLGLMLLFHDKGSVKYRKRNHGQELSMIEIKHKSD